MLESSPFASEDSEVKPIVLKSKNNACHRRIAEYKQPDDAGKEEQIKPFLINYVHFVNYE